jgi:hypothetical protein
VLLKWDCGYEQVKDARFQGEGEGEGGEEEGIPRRSEQVGDGGEGGPRRSEKVKEKE